MSKETARKSQTSTAYERLRFDLLTCKLRPGERLNINDLCQGMCLNLSAVREGLAKLTAEGLVIADPNRGFSVAPISISKLRDLTRVRIEIENLCLRSAIQLGDVAWEAAVLSSFHIMARTGEMEAEKGGGGLILWQVHADFHRALCAACDSPWLKRLREQLFAESERYRILSAPFKPGTRDVNLEHQNIMEAVLARDVDRATGLMTTHFELTTHLLLNSPIVMAELPAGFD